MFNQILFSQTGNITSGLIVYYKFDEGSGTTAFDSSGNLYTATLVNSATFTGSSKIGPYAVNTTGNAYVSASVSIPIGSTWTISTWTFFPIPGGAYKTLARDDIGGQNHHVLVNPSNELGCYLNSDSSGFHGSGYFITGLTGWHLITAVGSGSVTKFYIDAVLTGSSNGQATDTVTSVGNWGGGGGQPWGTFDDFRIYNRALAQADIQALYNYRY